MFGDAPVHLPGVILLTDNYSLCKCTKLKRNKCPFPLYNTIFDYVLHELSKARLATLNVTCLSLAGWAGSSDYRAIV